LRASPTALPPGSIGAAGEVPLVQGGPVIYSWNADILLSISRFKIGKEEPTIKGFFEK
jgi:hypothetical protein